MQDLTGALAPVLERAGLELIDVETGPGLLRVTVDRDGGVDLDTLAEANRLASSALDALDPFPGRYTLEVSSPGLERRLRRPEHFRRAVGSSVTVRTSTEIEGTRRLSGSLSAADAEGITVEGPDVPGGTQHLRYEEVDRARTVFEWGPPAGQRKGKRTPSTGSQPRRGRGHSQPRSGRGREVKTP